MIRIEHREEERRGEERREEKIRKKDSMRETKWKIKMHRIWEIVMLHYRDSRKGDDKGRR
jgi:hypothetical protein